MRFDETVQYVPADFIADGFIDTSSINIADSTFSGTALQRAERPLRSELLSTAIAAILRQGLSDRAKLVHVQPIDSGHVQVGIVYDPFQATRVIDIGPSSDKPADGEAFRKLWGEKAELRRFKDGSIAESVVWSVARPEDAALIPGKIVKWLLERHFGIAGSDVTPLSSDSAWLSSVQTPPSARNAICVEGSEKLGFRPVLDAYDELYRLLKSIDTELPLAILHVGPADEALRYSSTFVPHPIDSARWATAPDCLRYLSKVQIILQFESSPRWPDDLAAIQKVKLALLEKIARVIMARVRRAKAVIVLDADASEIEDHAALEVLLPQGVAFHLRIFHERERTLLQRIIDGDIPRFGTALPQPPKRLALPALQRHTDRFVHTPQHHAALAPLHHRFPSYSGATRLLKRWAAAHMLAPLQLRAEALELLMARVYLDPGTLSSPGSATAGFTRAMHLLAGWDWKEEPLFVPVFSASRGGADQSDSESQAGRVRFPAEKREAARARFEQRRKLDGFGHGQAGVEGQSSGTGKAGGAWVVVTEEDLDGVRWTSGVGRVVAGRVGALAKATLAALGGMAESGVMDVLVSLISQSGAR